MKLLYAEDEPGLSEAVVDILTYYKYQVDAVDNGTDAYDYAKAEHYDGMILDVMMPGMSGLEVLQKLRQEGCRTPIMLLTAKAEIEDRVVGLDLGADDYLPKPFAMKELLARVRAMLRRREEYTPNVLTCGDLALNQQDYTLSSPTDSVVLSETGIPDDGSADAASGRLPVHGGTVDEGMGIRYGSGTRRRLGLPVLSAKAFCRIAVQSDDSGKARRGLPAG